MELFKLENLRDEIQDRIKYIEKFNDEVSDNPMFRIQDYIRGLRDARICEVGFLDKHLESILEDIKWHSDTKVAKALGLERVDCDCEKCRVLRGETKDGCERLKNRADLKDVVGSFAFDPFLAMLRLCEAEKKPEPEIEDDKYVVESFFEQGSRKDMFESLEKANNYAMEMIKSGAATVQIIAGDDSVIKRFGAFMQAGEEGVFMQRVEEKNPPKKLKKRYEVNAYGNVEWVGLSRIDEEVIHKHIVFDSLEEAQNYSIMMITDGFKKVEITKVESE